jgi:hypothetical protein
MISHQSFMEIRDFLVFAAAHPPPSITREHERNPNCNLHVTNRKMNAARKKADAVKNKKAVSNHKGYGHGISDAGSTPCPPLSQHTMDVASD